MNTTGLFTQLNDQITYDEVIGKFRVVLFTRNNQLYGHKYNLNAKKAHKSLVESFRFMSESDRNGWVERTQKRVAELAEWKKERAERNKSLTPSKDLIGKIFYRSYGYDMTINEYVMVKDIKEKSVVAVEVARSVKDDEGRGNGKSYPTGKMVGEPKKFLVKKSYRDNELMLAGCGDTWWEYQGGGNYYNTWD